MIIVIIIIIISSFYIPYNYTNALGLLKLNTLQDKSTSSWDAKGVLCCFIAYVSEFPLVILVSLLCLALQAQIVWWLCINCKYSMRWYRHFSKWIRTHEHIWNL